VGGDLPRELLRDRRRARESLLEARDRDGVAGGARLGETRLDFVDLIEE